MRDQNVDSIRSFYPAWNRRDFDTALSNATADFEILPLPALLQRPTRGKSEAKRFWDLFFEAFDEIRVEPKEVLAESDEHVVAVLRWWARGRDGIEVERTMVDLWTFRGDLKASVQGFEKKSDALEAVRRSR